MENIFALATANDHVTHAQETLSDPELADALRELGFENELQQARSSLEALRGPLWEAYSQAYRSLPLPESLLPGPPSSDASSSGGTPEGEQQSDSNGQQSNGQQSNGQDDTLVLQLWESLTDESASLLRELVRRDRKPTLAHALRDEMLRLWPDAEEFKTLDSTESTLSSISAVWRRISAERDDELELEPVIVEGNKWGASRYVSGSTFRQVSDRLGLADAPTEQSTALLHEDSVSSAARSG
ncbi:MAG TPA: hypothetical protein VH306_08360 [Gaiellaceae bacterium]|jgi:hypothetical protein